MNLASNENEICLFQLEYRHNRSQKKKKITTTEKTTKVQNIRYEL